MFHTSIRTQVITLVVVTVLLIIRRWHLFQNPHLFAEDGLLFWLQNYEDGLGALWKPYAGYYHAAPRLAAWVSGFFDPAFAPQLFLGFAVLSHLLIVAILFSPRIPLPFKPAMACITVLVPHTTEVFANITNMQWIMALGIILLGISEDATNRRERLTDSALLVLLGLTGPFCVLFLPIFALRLMKRRSVDSLIVFLLCLGCALVQAYPILKYPGVGGTEDDPLLFLSILGFRTWGQVFTGFTIPVVGQSLLWVLLGIMMSVAFFHRSFKPSPEARLLRPLSLGWLGVLGGVAAKWLHLPGPLAGAENGDRYFYIPHVLFLWSLLVCMEKLEQRQRLAICGLVLFSIGMGAKCFIDEARPVLPWASEMEPVRQHTQFYIPLGPDRNWAVHHKPCMPDKSPSTQSSR